MSTWSEEVLAAAGAALPPLDGSVRVPGLDAPVEVLRDRWGIPSIGASSLDDLWFAQGFVTASERLFQIELTLRAARGRLSEWFGDLTLAQDRFARTIGFHRIGDREAARWRPPSREMYARFVHGVRAWVEAMPAQPFEYALLGAAPHVPEDLGAWAAAFALAAWGLSGNRDAELLRVDLAERLGPEAAEALLPPLAAMATVTAGGLTGRIPGGSALATGQGSNAWAVASSRTASGRPLLANDPHLLVQQPGAWFELHLRAPGYEARGVAFPFAPGILVGTTAHHGWGVTNVSGDVQDLYEERLDETGTAAEFDAGWESLVVHREEIVVRGGDPVAFDVRETRHGPLLEVQPVGLLDVEHVPLERTYALRWTATDGLLEPWMLVEIANADGFGAFRDALRGLSCPGLNVVYADVDGTIAYQLTGRYPVRRAGDGTVPVPGWTSEHEWDGAVPFDELPWSKDPEDGVVVTANNRSYAETYPHLIGRDFHAPYRARRIVELLGSPDRHGVEDMARFQADTVSLPARALLRQLTSLRALDDDERWALELLGSWDGDERADSVPAAIFHAWIAAIVREVAGEHDGVDRYLAWREPFVCGTLPALLSGAPPTWLGAPDGWEPLLRRALAEALASLADRLGSDRSAWRWGALHRVRFAHALARMPGLGEALVAAEHELGGDEQTVLQGGFDGRRGFDAAVVPSWRVVVDLGDVDRSMAVLPTGNSGNPASPHWNDQAALWIAGELRPAPVTAVAIRSAAVHSLTLVPGR